MVEEVSIWSGGVQASQIGGAVIVGMWVIGDQRRAPSARWAIRQATVRSPALEGEMPSARGPVPSAAWANGGARPSSGIHLFLGDGGGPGPMAGCIARSPKGPCGATTVRQDASTSGRRRSRIRCSRSAIRRRASLRPGGETGWSALDPWERRGETVADVDAVASLGFAEHATLVIVETDGTVRLWDTERADRIGTLGIGDGTAPPHRRGTPRRPRSSGGNLGPVPQFSLDPERWVERVCERVAREPRERVGAPGARDAQQRPPCDDGAPSRAGMFARRPRL